MLQQLQLVDEIEDHDSKLLKIKKALEADYQKSLLENVDTAEVNLLKVYFNRILDGENMTVSEILPILDEYIEQSHNEPYSNIVENIKVDLVSEKLQVEEFLDFVQKFTVQNYPIDIFYKRFFKKSPVTTSPIVNAVVSPPPSKPKPSLTDLFGDELEDLSDDESSDEDTIKAASPQPTKPKPSLTDLFGDELEDLSDDESSDEDTLKAVSPEETKLRARGASRPTFGGDLQKVRDRIEEQREEPKIAQVIEPRAEPRRGRIALVEDVPIPKPRAPEPKKIADKIFFETMAELTTRDCEFLYKKIPWVKDIINHIYVHPVEGDFKDIIGEKYIEHDGLKFYLPKKKYYMLQCHSHKIQDGNVLTIIKDGETYKLMVAIDTNTKGVVLQNEDMLKAEIDYIRVWNHNKNDHIKELRKTEPNEDMLLLAKFELSNALQDAIQGNVPIEYRSADSSFINTVVRTILKKANSGDSFVRLLANIIIFLKINLSFITSSVFIKRLREQIYLPGTLPFLTDADKLPEIFLAKNVPEDTRNFVLEKLEEERLRFTNNFFENLHIGSSTIRKVTKPILWNKPTQQIELPDIKTICKNKAEIEDENDEDIVFYTDLDEVYCFNVYKLYNLFREQDLPINPYTDRPFSNEFIQIFLTRYASKPLVKKIEHTQHVDLATRLEELIEQELSMLENNLIETENPEFMQKFISVAGPKKRISRVKETFEPKEKEGVEKKEGVKEDFAGAKDPDKCMECKTPLTANSDKITSVFRNKQIAFCGYDCLEKNKTFK